MHSFGWKYGSWSLSLISDISLWDNEAIKTEDWRLNKDSRRQPKTDLKFSASDSLNEKSKLLDVSTSLTASILGGLVDVGGSAKYMHDNKSSARQSRVSLQYSQTTRAVYNGPQYQDLPHMLLLLYCMELRHSWCSI